MNVVWIKCQGDGWCPLATVNLDHPHFNGLNGVYIIWHGGSTPATVAVGKGAIRDRLAYNRTDGRVQKFSGFGLFATWAVVSAEQQDGVIQFLVNTLKPIVPPDFSGAVPVQVNYPW